MKNCFCLSAALLTVLIWSLGRPVLAEEGKHCFILSGQSNMRQPLPDSFKDCVERVFGKEQVIVVTVSQPSQPIKRWYKEWKPPAGMTDDKPEDNGQLYDKLITSAQKATAGKSIASVTFVWMQGEADAGSGWGSVYEKSFFGILDQFKKDLNVKQVNFVLGRINDFWLDLKKYPDGELVRSVQQKLGDECSYGDWVNTDDLNCGVNPWGGFSFNDGHFPPPAYRVMGQRFAHKACRLIDAKKELDPGIFAEHFLDSATQITTHGAVGKSVVGTSASPKLNTPSHGLAALTDGKFGKADPSDGAWLGFAPLGGVIEFVLDLGEPQEVDTIALNVLITPQLKTQLPKTITFSTSANGESHKVNNDRYNTISLNDLKNPQKTHSDVDSQSLLLLTEQGKIRARYIKVQIKMDSGLFYIDEFLVNPSKDQNQK